jgi:large subunit ribosomal protein L20
MARVKRGVHAKKKHKAVLDRAKGFRGARSRRFKVAKEAVFHAERYAYRDRRNRKRDFRRLWIARINAAARVEGLLLAPDARAEARGGRGRPQEPG